MDLTPEEIRVLGALIEKERTTPDQYPMTTNALRLACNQKTSREPVVDYDERTVDSAMLALRDRRLARTVVSGGAGRAAKHKQVAEEVWGFGSDALAVLSVLALRGPQTPGELRSRTERLHDFGSVDEVVAVLNRLADRDEPFVTLLERRPGQKEARYAHLLAGEVIEVESASYGYGPDGQVSGSPGGARSAAAQRIEELEEEVGSLRSDLDLLRTQFDTLCERLGEAL